MSSLVADGLKAGTRMKPELFLEASVYFSDIDDFASFVSELSPLQRQFSLISPCSHSCLRDTYVYCRDTTNQFIILISLVEGRCCPRYILSLRKE